jgi:hypothetical protein
VEAQQAQKEADAATRAMQQHERRLGGARARGARSSGVNGNGNSR